MTKLVYFAWVRERIGRSEEEIDLPASVSTVADLLTFLKDRGEEYDHALQFPDVIRVALDQEHAEHDEPIGGAREIGIFSADDGRLTMAVAPHIRIQSEEIDLVAEIARLSDGAIGGIGAVVTFTGLCRDEGGTLSALELEHYPGMAEAEINRIAALAVSRFKLAGLTAIHRFGRVSPGETIVFVGAAAGHRQAAFDAASFVMDYLKTDAPFWKKEHRLDGTVGDWVSAKESDDAARARWQAITE